MILVFSGPMALVILLVRGLWSLTKLTVLTLIVTITWLLTVFGVLDRPVRWQR